MKILKKVLAVAAILTAAAMMCVLAWTMIIFAQEENDVIESERRFRADRG